MRGTKTRAGKPLNVSEDRVRGKLDECEYFIQQMKESGDVRKFGYHLSAFLSALRTSAELALMQRDAKGKAKALQLLKNGTDDIGSLLRSRDVEVHGEGVRIWLVGSLWGNLLVATRSRDSSRYRSKFQSRFGDVRAELELTAKATPETARLSFIFGDSGREAIRSCRSALDVVRSLANEELEARS